MCKDTEQGCCLMIFQPSLIHPHHTHPVTQFSFPVDLSPPPPADWQGVRNFPHETPSLCLIRHNIQPSTRSLSDTSLRGSTWRVQLCINMSVSVYLRMIYANAHVGNFVRKRFCQRHVCCSDHACRGVRRRRGSRPGTTQHTP